MVTKPLPQTMRLQVYEEASSMLNAVAIPCFIGSAEVRGLVTIRYRICGTVIPQSKVPKDHL